MVAVDTPQKKFLLILLKSVELPQGDCVVLGVVLTGKSLE